MAALTAAKRKLLTLSDFALPSQRKYPIPDKSHAANAKARAAQQAKAGHLNAAQKSQIDAKANKVLGKKSAPKSRGGLPPAPKSAAEKAAFVKRMAAARKRKKG